MLHQLAHENYYCFWLFMVRFRLFRYFKYCVGFSFSSSKPQFRFASWLTELTLINTCRYGVLGKNDVHRRLLWRQEVTSQQISSSLELVCDSWQLIELWPKFALIHYIHRNNATQTTLKFALQWGAMNHQKQLILFYLMAFNLKARLTPHY